MIFAWQCMQACMKRIVNTFCIVDMMRKWEASQWHSKECQLAFSRSLLLRPRQLGPLQLSAICS